MSWKKNIVSCLMWAAYLLMVGTAMVFTGRVICDSFGMAEYFEIVIPAVCLLATGIVVFMLHRLAAGLRVGSRGEGKGLGWIEGMLIAVLFTAGIFLRVSESRAESFVLPDESVYLKLAYISADGQGIPQFSHGAVYLYLWSLRLCFMLLGNKAAAAVWLQSAAQMLSVAFLYLAVRKMAGRIPAMVMAAFFMLSPYMIEKSLVPSPEMLYLMAFSLVMLYISRGVRQESGRGFWLAAGAMAAVLSYLDVAGVLLFPLALGVIVMRRQGTGKKKTGGLSGCLSGFLAGTAGSVLVDVISSGKSAAGIIRAWKELYQWGEVQLSVTISSFDTVWMIALLLCFMAWGVFGFWCSRGTERFTVWSFCLCIAVLLRCLGMFTEEMNGFCHIFLFSTILAGLGIRESVTVYPEVKYEGKMPPEEGDVVMELVEDIEVTEEEKGTVEEKDKTENRDSAERKENAAEQTADTAAGSEAVKTAEQPEKKRKIQFLENPLPLPKRHKKRVMDYKLDSDRDLNGYDVYVADDDDFDH